MEAVIGRSVAETCRSRARIGSRYGHVRLSTFGRVRRAGFAILPTLDHPHFDIVLPDLSEMTVARILSVDADGAIEVQVLPGSVESHRDLLSTAP